MQHIHLIGFIMDAYILDFIPKGFRSAKYRLCSRIIYIVMFCDSELCCGYNYDDNDQYRLSVD